MGFEGSNGHFTAKKRVRDSAGPHANTTKIHPHALDHVVVNGAGDGGGGGGNGTVLAERM